MALSSICFALAIGAPARSADPIRTPASHGHSAHLLHPSNVPPRASWSATNGAETFSLSATRLLPGSAYHEAQALNQQYLHYLEADRLLYQFRHFAGLDPTLGGTVVPYGGWESPTYVHGLINGHFTGHLLSALAFDAASSGDVTSAAKGDALIAGIAACQAAVAVAIPQRSGWVSAYGLDHLERLEAHNTTQVWAPYYTLHKIMAGLLDQYEQRGSAQAMTVLKKLAAYLHSRIVALKKAKGEAWWQIILNTEFGGMNELGYNLYSHTKDHLHKDLGDWFYKGVFMNPLSCGNDSLNGQHANTHLPGVVGVARGFEVTANATLKNVTMNFHQILGERYSYATGGSNVGEYWSSPDQLGDAVATTFNETTGAVENSNGFHTEETCTQYNSLKMLRHLFRWSPSSLISDDYEVKLVNGILGTQQRGVMGSMSYMTPLGRGVNRNHWDWYGFGSANNSFWCCYGTSVEQFAKQGDSVYFRSSENNTLFISLFIPSTFRWPTHGLVLNQTTSLKTTASPKHGGAVITQTTTVSLTKISTASSKLLELNIRIPVWAETGSALIVNNKKAIVVVAGTFCIVPTPAGGWKSGDQLTLTIVMQPRLKSINDKRAAYKNVAAIMVGPYVLGALTDRDNVLVADPKNVEQWVVPSRALHHGLEEADLRLTAVGATQHYELIALNRLVLQNYTIYLNISEAHGNGPLHP